MGIEIDGSSFGEADYRAFGLLLEENLECLQQLLSQPGFGDGPASLGSELELYVVDTAGNPLYANEDILADSGDPTLTLELNRYNLEFNLSAYALSGSAFASTEREILTRLGRLRGRAAARRMGTHEYLSVSCPPCARRTLDPTASPHAAVITPSSTS
ncbi:MAG: hypothetical protein MZW92_34425 [Comamonadaceae bacterium]|nr:hypothetical protein [Comamonadaceae bacterium]